MNMSDTEHRSWMYDDPERRKWQDPETVVGMLGIEPGITFMDIGCGNGYFTLPAARLAGDNGTIYALDSNAGAIDILKQKAHSERLNNIHAVAGRGEETVFCDACADIIFFGNVLHDFQDAALVLSNARKMIASHGRLYNVDWKPVQMDFGPPLRIRFSPEHAAMLIASAGFRIERTVEAGNYHYLIEATPVG
jgi:ubiquinone/menaquinone biosynthesis C-methylase UbiE